MASVKFDEWRHLAYLLMTGYPGSFTKDNIAGYFAFLEPYATIEVERAMRRLAANGGKWVPSVGEICGEIERVQEANVPTFDEVWSELVTRSMFRADPVGWLEDQGAHRYLIAWLASYGIKRMKMEPVNDPRVGGAVVNRIRVSYEEFMERARAREKQGRPILTEGTRRALGTRSLGEAVKEAMGELPKGTP